MARRPPNIMGILYFHRCADQVESHPRNYSYAEEAQSHPYNYSYANTNMSAPPSHYNDNDVYHNSGTQNISGLTTQVGIVKGHGNGATVDGSFIVR